MKPRTFLLLFTLGVALAMNACVTPWGSKPGKSGTESADEPQDEARWARQSLDRQMNQIRRIHQSRYRAAAVRGGH